MMTSGEDKPLSSRDISGAPPLNARAATRCPVRTHLDIDPPDGVVHAPVAATVQARMDEGIAFENDAMAALIEANGPIPSFRGDLEGARTAMAQGVPLLAQVPLIDQDGRRTGRPDLLVATNERTAAGAMVYLPVEIKAHKVTKAVAEEGDLCAVPLGQVGTVDLPSVGPDPALKMHRRNDDLLTLAHYHRLLEEAGHAGAEPVGVVIGTERLAAIFRLEEITFQSWRNFTGRWTTLQAYDREFGFRLDIAAVAADRAAGKSTEDPVVVPARNSECGRCPWEPVCSPQMESSDELTLLTGISWRERQELREAGIETRADLAAMDHGDLRTKTMAKAVDHARLHTAGISVARRRGVDDLVLPRADVEVDVDMESADQQVYLWGNLVSDGTDQAYRPFVDFSPDPDHRALFEAFWAWLTDLRDSALAHGRTFAAYCWSPAEDRYLRLYGQSLGLAAEVEAFIASECWVDLERVVKDHLITPDGRTSLKVIAPLAGFAWRDEDPGGDQSMLWYSEAVAGAESKRRRLLEYNTDDVRATLAVRDWLQATWPDLPSMADVKWEIARPVVLEE